MARSGVPEVVNETITPHMLANADGDLTAIVADMLRPVLEMMAHDGKVRVLIMRPTPNANLRVVIRAEFD